MKLEMNWQTPTEKYQLQDITWAVKQKKRRRTKQLKRSFRAKMRRRG